MKNLCKLNIRLLPIKLHFFFFYGAVAGVSPYMPVIAKGLGINAAAFGLIYTVIPFCVFLSKPFFGYLTDYFQSIKAIVFILVLITSTTFLSIIFIPQVETVSDYSELSISAYNLSCLKETFLAKRDSLCNERFKGCYSFDELDENSTKECPFNYDLTSQVTLTSTDNFFNCNFETDLYNCSVASCLCENKDNTDTRSNIYNTYQFWIFSVLAVISGTFSATVYCLTDTACYEVLDDRPDLYGRQRLWATISWGLITPFAGFLNDLATPPNAETNFSPGFYIMATLVFIDLLLLFKIKLVKPDFSLNICRDIGKIFSSSETIIFAVGVYVVGAFTSLIWNYEFWFLEDLGASQTLLGLAVGVQCLVAEIPMFFFSGWFIQKLGHFYCLVCSFVALSVRFLLYSFLKDPWYVLPIEVTQSFSYALFYASMTGYASANAPPGTEATMMGILGGLFEGLGVATGSFFFGMGFNKLGGRRIFRVAALISFVCVPLLLMTRCFFLKRNNATKEERKNIDATCHKNYGYSTSSS